MINRSCKSTDVEDRDEQIEERELEKARQVKKEGCEAELLMPMMDGVQKSRLKSRESYMGWMAIDRVAVDGYYVD